MIDRLKKWLDGAKPPETIELSEEIAVAALLTEVMLADGAASRAEQQRMEQLLARLFGQSQDVVHDWLEQGRAQQQESVSLYEFTSRLKALPMGQRENILHALWLIAFTDDQLDPLEEAVIRQTADLLYIPHSRFIQLKHRAEGQGS
ncbi:TerB family tellurite resistance protein [Zobellella endophytica]|uniref:TerB family tellurite resistance protein n=1 Tax=Zobellella endophytica TaxID=2116700 RepID=A0A2P7RCF6_9GAMM|nr:TerB family tellurite resistance protein [Zobellella endophytica]PSJ47889.1 TerB family tellurite resistance protein [Zobellella endophytica]